MGSETPRQPGTAIPAHQRRTDAATGHAAMVIKATAIHAMISARGTDARSYRAIAVRDGRIVTLTAEPDDADDLVGANTGVVDDPGLTVVPTCDDTPTHLIFAGRAADDVQVADAKGLPEFLDLIRRRAASTPRRAVDPHRIELARAATGRAAPAHRGHPQPQIRQEAAPASAHRGRAVAPATRNGRRTARRTPSSGRPAS
jgi:hypothetical protein